MTSKRWAVTVCLVLVFASTLVFAADRLVIKDGSNQTTFSVADNGNISTKGTLSVVKDLGNSEGLKYLGSFFRIPSGLNNGGLAFGYHADGTKPDYSFFYFPGGLDFSFNTYSGGMKNVLYAKASGEVGLGRSNPQHPLHMASGAYIGTDGKFHEASSRAYKTDIKELEASEALKAFELLNPVEYKFKDGTEETHLGFIAEDVPDLVASKDRKGLSSMDIVALLTKVLKEQQKTINQLKAKIDALENLGATNGALQ